MTARGCAEIYDTVYIMAHAFLRPHTAFACLACTPDAHTSKRSALKRTTPLKFLEEQGSGCILYTLYETTSNPSY